MNLTLIRLSRKNTPEFQTIFSLSLDMFLRCRFICVRCRYQYFLCVHQDMKFSLYCFFFLWSVGERGVMLPLLFLLSYCSQWGSLSLLVLTNRKCVDQLNNNGKITETLLKATINKRNKTSNQMVTILWCNSKEFQHYTWLNDILGTY